MTSTPQAPALDDAATAKAGDKAQPRASGDSPKPHGDKLGAGAAATATIADAAGTGDSPKPHGDKLGHAVGEAAKR